MRLPWPATVHWLLTTLAVVLCASVGGILSAGLESGRLAAQLQVDLALRRELLHSEIERHRMLPTLLADNPQLAEALDRAAAPTLRQQRIEALNQSLARLASADGAATLYLVGADGITVAASNFQSPTSFVGQDYSFRPYFSDAMRNGSGQLFAQGTVSGVAGLYLAQQLRGGEGVIVTKVEFAELERNWRSAGDETFVVDANGTVLLTSNPALRFSSGPGKQADSGRSLSAQLPARYNDWSIIQRRDIRRDVFTARVGGTLLGGLTGLLAALGVWVLRNDRARRDRHRQELETLVTNRTEELEASNRRLRHEMEERTRSAARIQQLREELAQANRLAILGQISAGVAHEINQPLAAIRTYVDNAHKLIARGDTPSSLKSLASVITLTERVGLITNQLREFSRRTPTKAEPLQLVDAIEGSMLLLDQKLRAKHIALLRPDAPERHVIFGNRTQLEQVVVNLVQNAIEALESVAEPRISIAANRVGDDVFLSISDNGPGIAPDKRGSLFAPFFTSKPLGLGLGLVICRDIVSDMGGSLEFSPGDAGGSVFIARFPAWVH